MLEFLKSYGIWIFLVLMLGMHLVPMFRRGRGTASGMGGCCGGSDKPDQPDSQKKGGQQAYGKQSSC